MIFSPQIERIWKWSLQLSRRQLALIAIQTCCFSAALFQDTCFFWIKQNKTINLDLLRAAHPSPPPPPQPCQSSFWGVQDVFSNKNGMTCYKYRVNFSLFDLGIKGRSEKWFTASLDSVSWTFLMISTFSARRFCEREIWSPQNVCKSSLLGFVIRMLQCQLWLHTLWAFKNKQKKIQLDPGKKKKYSCLCRIFHKGRTEKCRSVPQALLLG